MRAISPVDPSGITVLWARTLVDGAPFGLDAGVVDPGGAAAHLGSLPQCGCDACDDGSAPLLEAVDEVMLIVARGGVVLARGHGSIMRAGIESWGGSGWGSESWLDDSLEAPTGVTRWAGSPWWPRAEPPPPSGHLNLAVDLLRQDGWVFSQSDGPGWESLTGRPTRSVAPDGRVADPTHLTHGNHESSDGVTP